MRVPGKRVLLFLVLMALGRHAAQAGQDKEIYVNTYRSIGTLTVPGQRSASMGRTGVGLADGVDSLGGNPAGLGAYTGYGVDGGVGFDLLDDGDGNVTQSTFRLGGAVSLESWRPSGSRNQTVGAMVHTQRYSGAGDTDMKRQQTGLVLGYGAHLLDDVVAGVSAAIYDGDWSAQGNAWTMDRSFTGGEFKVGGIWRLDENLTAGAVIGYSTGSYHERGSYAANGGSTSLGRWNLRAGAAYQLCDETLVAGDIWYDRMDTKVKGAFDERNTAWGMSAGIEHLVLDDLMALRGGMYYDSNSYKSNGLGVLFPDGGSYSKGRFGFTAGTGIRLYSFDVGYSLDVNTGGNIKNYLDVSAEW